MIFLYFLRGLFLALMIALAWYIGGDGSASTHYPRTVLVMLAIGIFVVFVDVVAPRRKLAIFSGTFLGLFVGLTMSYAFSFLIGLLADTYVGDAPYKAAITNHINIVAGAVFCYLAISFILQTKDDFRFIIPYVEFSKQTKGARPVLLDTSVLIDGRIADICETGIVDSRLIVPRFVLKELQFVADSGDKLKRNRGRRGLDVLQRLQNNKRLDVVLYDAADREQNEGHDVDGKLMTLAAELNCRVLTNDFNLNKVASLRGVSVININDLANALKPVVLPGEHMTVRLIKAGESPGQGVGYLEDGTMVVVEQGRPHINEEINFAVTSVLQTSAGKMIFGRMEQMAPDPEIRRPRPRPEGKAALPESRTQAS
jgi:uncharacterized protein YacL